MSDLDLTELRRVADNCDDHGMVELHAEKLDALIDRLERAEAAVERVRELCENAFSERDGDPDVPALVDAQDIAYWMGFDDE